MTWFDKKTLFKDARSRELAKTAACREIYERVFIHIDCEHFSFIYIVPDAALQWV